MNPDKGPSSALKDKEDLENLMNINSKNASLASKEIEDANFADNGINFEEFKVCI